jgi:hypothetical protein
MTPEVHLFTFMDDRTLDFYLPRCKNDFESSISLSEEPAGFWIFRYMIIIPKGKYYHMSYEELL